MFSISIRCASFSTSGVVSVSHIFHAFSTSRFHILFLCLLLLSFLFCFLSSLTSSFSCSDCWRDSWHTLGFSTFLSLRVIWPGRGTAGEINWGGTCGKNRRLEKKIYILYLWFPPYFLLPLIAFSCSLSLSLAFPSHWSLTLTAKQRGGKTLWYFGRWEWKRQKKKYRERGGETVGDKTAERTAEMRGSVWVFH